MDARKVLEMGGGTFLVSIPKAWAVRNGVKKGATLAVEELSSGKLIIRPIGDRVERPRETSIAYPKSDIRVLANDVTGAYLMGFEVIHVFGKKVITREDRASLKGVIARLIGLEIMDEDSKQITVQFLLEPSAIDPERVVKRISRILEGMLKDTAEAVAKKDSKLLSLVEERDDEVDRLYFLLVRTIRTAIIHPEVAEGYKLAPVDVLDYRVLASFLESVGDALAKLSAALRAVRLTKPLALEYAACLSELQEMGALAIKTFIPRGGGRSAENYEAMYRLSDQVEQRVERISQLPEGQGPQVLESLGALERVRALQLDISDLAVTMQPAS